jgi:peptidoglycan/LPS O-acetylase OafA/YrhL
VKDAAAPRRSFKTLDGLRGVGAFLVVMRHVALFGPIKVPESFLAVDLFYLVSGFVVSHAYGERLQAGGFFVDFFKTRLIRLYPLYIFGLALGFGPALFAVIHDPHGWWTAPRLAGAVATGLFMIPFFPGLAANGSSLDGPTWTLLPELIANMVYAAAIRFMTIWVLSAICLVCGAALVFAEFHYGTLDGGYGGTDQWEALARVGFSFFAGVLVFRFFGSAQQISTWVAWSLMAALTFILAFSPSEDITPYYELGVVLVGFPVLLILAARFEPASAWSGRLFAFVGLVSYGVYIVHQPMGVIVRDTIQRVVHVPTDIRGVAVGAVFMAAAVALAWWLDGHYDAPVRKRLRAIFMPAPGRPS